MEYTFIPFFDVQLFVLSSAVIPAMVPAPPGIFNRREFEIME